MDSCNYRRDGYLGDVVTIETAVQLIVGDLARMTDSEIVQLLLRIREKDDNPFARRVEPLVRSELSHRRSPVEALEQSPSTSHQPANAWHG